MKIYQNGKSIIDMEKFLPRYIGIMTASLFSGIRVNLGSVLVRPFDIFLLIGVLFWISFSLKSDKYKLKKYLLKNNIILIFILFRIYLLINGFLLGDITSVTIDFIQSLEFVIYIMLLAHILVNTYQRDIFFRAFFYVLGFIAIYNMIWHISNGELVLYKTLGAPALSHGVFSTLALFFYSTKKMKIKYIKVIFPISIIIMILSLERKGWIAFLLILFAIILKSKIKIKNKVKKIIKLGILIFFILLLSYQINPVRDQINSIGSAIISLYQESNYSAAQTRSNRSRIYLLTFSINSLKASPIFGIGSGNFKKRINSQAPKDYLVRGPHNIYFKYLVENGVIGLFIFILLLLAIFKKINKYRNVINNNVFIFLTFILFLYGQTVNLFLGGGSLNTIFYVLPAGLILSYKNNMILKMYR